VFKDVRKILSANDKLVIVFNKWKRHFSERAWGPRFLTLNDLWIFKFYFIQCITVIILIGRLKFKFNYKKSGNSFLKKSLIFSFLDETKIKLHNCEILVLNSDHDIQFINFSIFFQLNYNLSIKNFNFIIHYTHTRFYVIMWRA
jgi:hypothetical protein